MPKSWEKMGISNPTAPRYLAGFFKRPEPLEGNGSVGALIASAEASAKAWVNSFTYTADRLDDPTRTPAANRLRSAEYIKRQLERADQVYSETLAHVGPRLAGLKAKLESHFVPPTTSGSAAIHSEIRALVRAMTPEDRNVYLGEALEAGDHETLRAVLSAPGSLSNTVAPTRDRLRRAFWEKVEPEALKEADALDAGLSAATQALQSLVSHADELQADWGDINELRKRAAEPPDPVGAPQ